MNLLKKHFPGQKEGENISLLIRKHWVTDVKSGAIVLLIGFFPTLVCLFIAKALWQTQSTQVFWGFVMGFIVYLLFISLITYIHWLNDELDIIVVTDRRVISHEQIDLFHRQVSETNVTQIEDVKGVEKGLFQNLLHYGTLEIMTSSNDVFFTLNYVDRPYENARKLLDLREKSLTTPHAR